MGRDHDAHTDGGRGYVVTVSSVRLKRKNGVCLTCSHRMSVTHSTHRHTSMTLTLLNDDMRMASIIYTT